MPVLSMSMAVATAESILAKGQTAAETAAALRRGWYYSGDLGYADEKNYIFLMDRAKDMIVTGAENVYCVEVEEVLHQHPAVLQAAVFGIPDEKWGEAVHAAIQLRHPVEAEELIAFCHGIFRV